MPLETTAVQAAPDMGPEDRGSESVSPESKPDLGRDTDRDTNGGGRRKAPATERQRDRDPLEAGWLDQERSGGKRSGGGPPKRGRPDNIRSRGGAGGPAGDVGQTDGAGEQPVDRPTPRARGRASGSSIRASTSHSMKDVEQTMYSHPQQGAGQEAQRLRQQAGQWLRDLRKGRNLSQRDLARLVHVEYYTFISQIEAGKGRIPPDRYTVWAEALGVAPREFVKTILRYYDPVTYEILFSNGEDNIRVVETH